MAARVIMTASGKGGTGKSTVSVFMAGCLAARGRKVLLVELDCGLRSIDYIAGVSGKTVYDIGDILSGRCETGKAIVESPLYGGLYVVSAPYAGGEVRAEALSAFVRSAREVFDDIVLDTAAGMGAPFLAAMAVCDMCVIVITPDPVAMRDGRIVCDAVAAAGCENIRLVINRVPRRAADAAVGDFDLCIDTVGAQLLGVVPESAALAAACASGKGLAQAEPAHAVFRAIAARLCGERVPLIVR
ncbi:MAG TPA: AAA family ATPase [Candidatus Ruthenibacterium merdigallinarum]|nr:AAA family ATPase [Candidatus Ruthenibacterium merdigallinarum]